MQSISILIFAQDWAATREYVHLGIQIQCSKGLLKYIPSNQNIQESKGKT